MRLSKSHIISLIIILVMTFPAYSQNGGGMPSFDIDDDDINIGGDIFSDFNEDIEATQVMEDERFYRYGRFYSLNMGLGYTTFTGNRGAAYENDPPTFGLSLTYFFNFQSAFGMGFEYSKHHFYIDKSTHAYDGNPPGLIDVSMLRGFFSYRYYIDTSNLGTAITYSNPYFISRFEIWYVTNKFRDQTNLQSDSGVGVGFGVGGGFEFPMEINKSYINVELLMHTVNFHDKYTQNYRPLDKDIDTAGEATNGFGYDDLTGYVFSVMVNYVISW